MIIKMFNSCIGQPEDLGIVLADILESAPGEEYRSTPHADFKGGNQLNPNYKSQANTIHSTENKSPTICAGTHGYALGHIKCAAMRGRYLVDGVRQDGKMLTAGLTEQRLEIRKDDKTNCLTSVQKDNLIIRQKSKCVRSSGRGSVDRHEWDSISNCHYRKLTPLECERLQTVPDNHTNHVSNTQRYKMLGNGWTIDVIAHIFKKLIRG